MKKSYAKPLLLTGVFAVTTIIATGVTPHTSFANDEFRAAAVLQIPFWSEASTFKMGNVRIGGTLQYADVEETEVVGNPVTSQDEGNQVYGVEVNTFFEPFSGWNPSVEVLGFFGTNDVQAALGGGYSWAVGWYGNAKIMFPYSEIGVRFIAPFEVYGGVKTFGDFDPDTNTKVNETDGGEEPPQNDGGEETPQLDGGEETPQLDGGEETPQLDGGEETPQLD